MGKKQNKLVDHTNLLWKAEYSQSHDCWFIHAGEDTIACFYGRDAEADVQACCQMIQLVKAAKEGTCSVHVPKPCLYERKSP